MDPAALSALGSTVGRLVARTVVSPFVATAGGARATPGAGHVLADTGHAGTIPLFVVGAVLFVVAGVVRRLIRLALLVAVVGAVAVALAAWRAGAFG